MKLENWEDWFAARSGHKDDDIWTGRISFDLEEGIEFITARFIEGSSTYVDETFNSDVITGYLDFQRPATLLNPFVRSYGGITFSANTPGHRTSLKIGANGVLKNFHLEDIKARCFSGLRVELPSVFSWFSPDIVKRDKNNDQKPGSVTLRVEETVVHSRTLKCGHIVEVIEYATSRESVGQVELKQRVELSIKFEQPINMEEVEKLMWRTNTVFSFMAGSRLAQVVHKLETTETRTWNDVEQPIVAEYWFRPISKMEVEIPDAYSSLFSCHTSDIDFFELLDIAFSGEDKMIYLMDNILAVEESEQQLFSIYGEFLGCLEDFDRKQFGSGTDQSFKASIKDLAGLVENSGNESQRNTFAKLRTSYRNEFSLRGRLERMTEQWAADGFRGNPDFKRIVELRNDLSHGRALKITQKDAQMMYWYLNFLAALARYQIWKSIGYSSEDVANAFKRKAHMFGMFAPKSEGLIE